MKCFVAIVALALAGFVSAAPKPGGYTANGGVYNPDTELDYMEHARSAGNKILPI